MPITREERAEINRENAQKSTGPKTEQGKAVSRCNALKHGLAATTIVPVDAPGEPRGAFQARLDAWVEDLQPRNVLEMAMIQRACRASWKLDRCARYEDANAAEREANPAPDSAGRRRQDADYLGRLLMFQLLMDDREGPPQKGPDPFDDAPGTADALCQFKEGVDWLLDAWAGVLAALPDGDGPSEGSDEFVRRTRQRARRLLGVPTGLPDPAQPLREAGEAEVRRLRSVLAGMTSEAAGRVGADLALFCVGPEAQLLMRYESLAEREFHRAVDAFLKLRKDPDLIAPPEPEPEPAAPPARPAPRTEPPPARDEPSPARNEPSPAGHIRHSEGVPTPPDGRRTPLIESP